MIRRTHFRENFRFSALIVVITIFITLPGFSRNTAELPGVGARVDSLFRAAEKNGFHGVVLLEMNGKIILNKGYGFANESTKLRFNPSVYVQIGSNVKDFTKVCIYQLVEEGKLKLTDSLGKFVPGLSGSKLKITVQNLLDHKAGLPLGIKPDNEPFTTEEMLTSLRTLQLKAEPGKKMIYSNLGYSCLAYIVEKTSGESFDQYVYDNILKPIGSLETGSFIPGFNRENIAHGYKDKTDIGIVLDMPHNRDGHLWSLRGNGGYLSTTSDMNKFYNSLKNSSILREEKHRKEVFDPSGSIFLAGSDLVSFFVFCNIPASNAQLIIGTNHSGYKGSRIAGVVESMLQPQSESNHPGGGKIERQIDEGGNEYDFQGPRLDKLPEQGAGITIRKYMEAYNTGDADKLKAYFLEYANNDGSVPVEKRIQNSRNLFGDLGRISFVDCDASREGIWEVNMLTDSGQKAKFVFFISPDKPWKFQRLQVETGGE